MTGGKADASVSADEAGAPAGIMRFAELLLCAAGLCVALWVLLSTVLTGGIHVAVRVAGAAVGGLLIWVFLPRQVSARARTRWALARIALLVAIVVAAAVETGSFNREQSQRARASEIIIASKPYRDAIAKRLSENPGRTDAGRDLPALAAPQGVQAHVAPDGTVTLTRQWRARDPASVMRIAFIPRIDPATNGVVWTCRGEPASSMPAACR